MKFSANGVEYLDLFIYTKNENICTRIYCKPCDPHAYLLPSSCHATHIFKNIPLSVLSRVKKNCSDPDISKIELEIFSNYLKNRQYSPKCIQEAKDKLETIPRTNLYALKEPSSTPTPRAFP